MLEIPVLDHDAVLAAVPLHAAITHTRESFLAHRRGDWTMPAKVYLDSAPYGDFRAMPALGSGFALLKWVSSFPANRARDLPPVHGIVCLSDATTGIPLMLLDARAVTALRTGAVAAVASDALVATSARSVGIIGCGVHGQWAARAMVEAGYSVGVCADTVSSSAERLADELGWQSGSVVEALSCDVVCCVTPGSVPVVDVEALRRGQHYNMLGADGPGKAEASVAAVAACRLFCDDWIQASHGGELARAVETGAVDRSDVKDLGDVLAGSAPGRRSADDMTMFDSTGLATQDLAIAVAAWQSLQAGEVDAQSVKL